MAGAGAKLFTSGSVLTADQVNTYLMDQTIMKFATTTARDNAFGGAGEPTLSEGMFAYTSDTDTLWFYTGSAWEVATIKPSLVDAKGDLLAGTADNTIGRLAVGTDGKVLTAASGESTGLQWTTISAGATYTSYTPTITGITLGNGTLATSYAEIGKFVHYVGRITFGSTTSITTNPQTSLPVNSDMVFTNNMGTGMCNDSNTNFYPIAIFSISTTTAQFICWDVSTYVRTNFIGTGQPFTWATGDYLTWNIYYKAA